MNDIERKDMKTGQITATYEDPFVPDIGLPNHPTAPELRQARALEYIAYQMFMIRKALEERK